MIMEIGKPFKNIEEYNERMAKSMEDKLFFVEKLPSIQNYLFVDFGCADGSMIRELVKIYGSSCSYIGYDCSDIMIGYAKKLYDLDQPVTFTTDWDTVLTIIGTEKKNKKIVLILSSVIHEVYSYGNQSDIDAFWNKIWCAYKPSYKYGFDYICIRDMMYSSSINRISDQKSVEKIHLSEDPWIDLVGISDFERIWGSLKENKNLVHFLLKYRWRTNWERELNENYFPISIENFMEHFDGFFRLDYFEKFRVRFLEECIYKDFGIILEDTTHIKAILIKEDNCEENS